jgi:hypothetical protein
MTDERKTRKPARGYSWPPFEKGNMAHLTHGARSERVVVETMSSMLPGVIERAPWLADPIYADERERYLRNAAKERLLGDYILTVSETKGIEHVASRTLEQHTAASRLATQQAEGLGLTPKGFVSIHSTIASMRTPREAIDEFLARGQAGVGRYRDRIEAAERRALEQAEQAPEQVTAAERAGTEVDNDACPSPGHDVVPNGPRPYASGPVGEPTSAVFKPRVCAATPEPFFRAVPG